MRKLFILIIFLSLCSLGAIPGPPLLRDEPLEEQQYLKTLYDNHNVLDITTTDPNTNIRGSTGEIIIYNNSGTYILEGNTDGDTAWTNLSTAGGSAFDTYLEEGDAAKTNTSTSAMTLDFDGGDFNTSVTANELDLTIEDSGIDHDATTNFVANEHLDWTNETNNLLTTGTLGSNDIDITDDDPHLKFVDSDAGDKDFEIYADDNQWYLTDFDNSLTAIRIDNNNNMHLHNGGLYAGTGVSGVLTLGGSGGANNEGLTFDFESDVNDVIIDGLSGAGTDGIIFNLDTRWNDGKALEIGSSGDAELLWQTTGNDNLQLGLKISGAADRSGYFSILEHGDLGNANRSPSGTSADPVLRIYSSDATQASDYIEFYHDQTASYIVSANGDLVIYEGGDVVISNNDTTPDAKLHVCDDQDDRTAIRIDNTNAGTDITHTALDFYDGSTVMSSIEVNNNDNDVLFEAHQGALVLSANQSTENLYLYGGSAAEVVLQPDVRIADATPHLEFEDTDAGDDDFEIYVDDNQVYITNLDDVVTLLRIDNAYDSHFKGAVDAGTVFKLDNVTVLSALDAETGATDGLHIGFGASGTGTNTICIGKDAGKNSSGAGGIVLGNYAGDAGFTNDGVVLIGPNAGGALTSGRGIVAIGSGALASNLSGSNIIAIGTNAGNVGTATGTNVFIGGNTGFNCVSTNNVLIGNNAGQSINSGGYNFAMGSNALYTATTGERNVIIGASAQNKGTDPDRNMCIGYFAGRYGLNDDNVFIGNEAGEGVDATTTTDGSIGIGSYALSGVTTGNYQSFIGFRSGEYQTTGGSSVGIGLYAGRGQSGSTTSANFNNFIGAYSGEDITTGDDNNFIGGQAGRNVTTGSDSVLIGTEAGELLTTGGACVYIGHQVGKSNLGANDSTNLLAIDNSDTATPLIYGDFSTDDIIIYGDQKIADADPHLEFEDTDTGDDDFEIYADDDSLYITDLDNSRVLMRFDDDGGVAIPGRLKGAVCVLGFGRALNNRTTSAWSTYGAINSATRGAQMIRSGSATGTSFMVNIDSYNDGATIDSEVYINGVETFQVQWAGAAGGGDTGTQSAYDTYARDTYVFKPSDNISVYYRVTGTVQFDQPQTMVEVILDY